MQTDFTLFMEVKELKEDGTFQGIASVYGVEDLGGDVIEPGAFKKTLGEKATVPILWQHRTDEVIGQGDLREWQRKILLDATLDMEDPTAQKAYRKLKSGLIKGLSIGFSTVKATFEEVIADGAAKFIRHISELKLWEVSIVTFPMLPAAQVTRVKSTEEKDIEARVLRLENDLLALRAANATPVDPGAGEGKEAAETKTTEPEALHSWSSAFRNQLKAQLAGTVRRS